MDIDGNSVGVGAEVEPTAREEPDGRSLWVGDLGWFGAALPREAVPIARMGALAAPLRRRAGPEKDAIR
jgi:hypothetical protein